MQKAVKNPEKPKKAIIFNVVERKIKPNLATMHM